MKKRNQTLLLAFSTLVLLVSITMSAPAQEPTRNFTGNWDTVTSKGKKFVLTMRHDRSDVTVVTGNYNSANALSGSYKPWNGSTPGFVKVSALIAPVVQTAGHINGTVKDNVLRFTWVEDGGRGAGRLTLSSDGESFEGTFSATDNPDDTSGGTWNGTRKYSFAGAWQGKIGDTGMQLVLQQSGDLVTGQLTFGAQFALRGGSVGAGNTLRFQVVRPGQLTTGGRVLPDEFVGTGELVMDKGGKSFKGKILGVDASGTLIGRSR